MGLTSRLERLARTRPHVLLAACPGGTSVRLEAERFVLRRGWTLAATPADADLLLECGLADGRLQTAIDRVWDQIPGPRARAAVQDVTEIPSTLERLRTQREDTASHGTRGRRDHQPTDRTHGQPTPPASTDHGDSRTHESGMDHGAMDHGALDHGAMDHGGMEGMDMPAGLPMAESADDRDGLTLDQLHLQLGPVLREWPAGLVLNLTLQGDVVQTATPEVWGLPTRNEAFWSSAASHALRGGTVQRDLLARRTAAAHLDSIGRLLQVAGWSSEAVRFVLLRSDLLNDVPQSTCRSRLSRLAHRLERSRVMRRTLSGIGFLDEDRARELGVSGPARRAGQPSGADADGRCRQWLTEAVQALKGGAQEPEAPRGSTGSGPLLTAAAELMVGCELATARIVLASFDPDPEELLVGQGAGAGSD